MAGAGIGLLHLMSVAATVGAAENSDVRGSLTVEPVVELT
jgi:hypothetical protein